MKKMTLGQKQELFSRLLPRLIDHANVLGFGVRMGEVLRFEEQARYNASHCRKCKKHKSDIHHRPKIVKHHPFKAIGIVNSLHRQKLAVDLILFRRGKPLWTSGPYLELNEFWEGLHELCATGRSWGDAGHFSLMHGGRK